VNAFSRLVMLIIALLLIGVPVLLLLVDFGILSANQINAFTGYRNALDALGGLSAPAIDPRARVVTGLIGVLVALVALLLLLLGLTFGRPVARKAFIDDTPGRETAITAQAVRRLAEGAAREVGAASPTCYLASEDRSYRVSCNILVPARTQNLTDLAARARENIQRVLQEQQVPVKDVEVTVQGRTV
jgi:hypothetical protein